MTFCSVCLLDFCELLIDIKYKKTSPRSMLRVTSQASLESARIVSGGSSGQGIATLERLPYGLILPIACSRRA